MSNLDWKNLPFGYHKTHYNVRCYWRNGVWGQLEVSSSETINIHIAATSLHYGQECFEGLKAFRGKDGKVRVFRWQENAKRMQNSNKGLMMPQIPSEIFGAAMVKAIELNQDFIPPFGSGASLYIRPLMIGTGPQIGVKPAEEYLFMILVTPVGPYFKEGFNPVDIVIMRDVDRAAPNGTGNIKAGGNYAASLVAGQRAKNDGFAAVLYLDPKEKKFLDECGPANFFGIKNNTYITPQSNSILPSITNMSIMVLAKDMGMTVEQRRVEVTELPDFEECGECGTAAVITPIRRIYDADTNKEYTYTKDNQPGPICIKLYTELRGIQYGEIPDRYGWNTVIDL